MAKCLYSSEEYCGPLSETISSGMPCLLKIDLVLLITVLALVLRSSAISGYLHVVINNDEVLAAFPFK